MITSNMIFCKIGNLCVRGTRLAFKLADIQCTKNKQAQVVQTMTDSLVCV